MRKFKIGDRVIRTQDTHAGMSIGHISTVIDFASSGVVLAGYGDKSGYVHDESKLKLLPPPLPPEASGDKIEEVLGVDPASAEELILCGVIKLPNSVVVDRDIWELVVNFISGITITSEYRTKSGQMILDKIKRK